MPERGPEPAEATQKGYLYRYEGSAWVRRYFELHRSSLRVFERHEEFFRDEPLPREQLLQQRLRGGRLVFLPRNALNRAHCFQLVLRRTSLYLSCMSLADMLLWTAALQRMAALRGPAVPYGERCLFCGRDIVGAAMLRPRAVHKTAPFVARNSPAACLRCYQENATTKIAQTHASIHRPTHRMQPSFPVELPHALVNVARRRGVRVGQDNGAEAARARRIGRLVSRFAPAPDGPAEPASTAGLPPAATAAAKSPRTPRRSPRPVSRPVSRESSRELRPLSRESSRASSSRPLSRESSRPSSRGAGSFRARSSFRRSESFRSEASSASGSSERVS